MYFELEIRKSYPPPQPPHPTLNKNMVIAIKLFQVRNHILILKQNAQGSSYWAGQPSTGRISLDPRICWSMVKPRLHCIIRLLLRIRTYMYLNKVIVMLLDGRNNHLASLVVTKGSITRVANLPQLQNNGFRPPTAALKLRVFFLSILFISLCILFFSCAPLKNCRI